MSHVQARDGYYSESKATATTAAGRRFSPACYHPKTVIPSGVCGARNPSSLCTMRRSLTSATVAASIEVHPPRMESHENGLFRLL